MSDRAATASLVGPGAVELERTLPGPVERVWAYLTDPELRSTWLAGGTLEPRVGGLVTLSFRHAEITRTDDPPPPEYRVDHESGHVAHGVVTAWQPPRLLRHTWDSDGEPSEVTFEVRDAGDAVVLRITHRRLDTRAAVVSVAAGWDAHVATLVARLSGAETPAFWRAHASSVARHDVAFERGPDADGRPPGAATLRAEPGGRYRLDYRRSIEATVDAVWRALADDAARDRWYPAELRFEGPVGGWARERFPDDPTPLPEGTLTAWDPPMRLAFTIEADPDADEPSVRHEQSLAFELAAEGDATALTMSYGFGEPSLAASVGAGWHGCLDALAAVAEGREVAVDHEALRGMYAAWFAGVGATSEA